MLTPVQRELKRKYIKYLNATESVDKNMIVDCITNYMTPEIDIHRLLLNCPFEKSLSLWKFGLTRSIPY